MKKLIALSLLPLIAFSVNAKWRVNEYIDDMTDSRQVIAKEGYGKKFIVVQCIDDDFDVVVSHGKYIGNEKVETAWRFDKGPINRTDSYPSSKGTAVFFITDIKYSIARDLTKYKSVIFETPNYRLTKHRSSFLLTGAKEVIEQVMKACKVNYAVSSE